jgi:hypothetical protein
MMDESKSEHAYDFYGRARTEEKSFHLRVEKRVECERAEGLNPSGKLLQAEQVRSLQRLSSGECKQKILTRMINIAEKAKDVKFTNFFRGYINSKSYGQ